MNQPKTFHKPLGPSAKKPSQRKTFKNPIIDGLWSRYLSVPRKTRLYIACSTFVVAFASDYYLTQKEKSAAAAAVAEHERIVGKSETDNQSGKI